MTRFANPELLGLLILVPVMIYWYIRRHRRMTGTVRFSNIGTAKQVQKSLRPKLRHSLFVLRIMTVVLVIVALARPQSGKKEQKIITEGIDIILSMDVSSSMLAEDFKPKNRLEAAKVVAGEFINGRSSLLFSFICFLSITMPAIQLPFVNHLKRQPDSLIMTARKV